MKAPLPAKITRPQPTRVLARTRLFRQLDGARKHPVIWITAPPGAGKTTLVSSYLDQRKLKNLWYQVDESDADVATLFHYLRLAVKKAVPRTRKPLPHLSPEYLPSLAIFARRYFQDMYSRLKPPFVLILDNYQEAPIDTQFQEVVAAGLTELPQGGNAILISRSDPPPAFARLRAHEAISLLDWDELKLTLDESKGIVRLRLQKRYRKRYEEETLRSLHDKTQGWTAGLVLALEQEKHRDLPQQLTPSFIPQVIFDYFASEIFAHADHDAQEVLLKTAFLPKTTARMAEHLTGLTTSARILADLNRKNYFTLKHSDLEAVYEYHPLFREFLLARAKETFTPNQLSEIQRAAAIVLIGNQQPEQAVPLLKIVGDWDKLAELIGEHAQTLVSQGRNQTLAAWLHSFPAEVLVNYPWLPYWLGICRLSSDTSAARDCFIQAFALFKNRHDAAGIFLSWCGIIDAFIYEWNDLTLLDPWIAEMEEQLNRYPKFPSPEIQVRVAFAMFAVLMYRQPWHPQLSAWEERIRAIMLNSAKIPQQVAIWHQLLWRGDLSKAAIVIKALRPLTRSPGMDPLLRIIWHGIEAHYYWMTASHEACLQAVEEGLEIGHTHGIHLWDFMLFAQGVRGSLTGNDVIKAREYLSGMAERLNPDRHLNMALYHDSAGIEALWRGDIGSSLEHARVALAEVEKAGMPFGQAMCHLTAARALSECGEYDRAGDSLIKVHEIGKAMQNPYIEYLYLLAQARLILCQGQEVPGREILRQALAVAKRQGFLNHMWFRHDQLAWLCAKALEHNIEVEFIHTLIRKRNLVPDTPSLHVEAWPWPVKLYTLGRFTIIIDGEPLRFTGKAQRKPLELLMALIAFGGRDVSEQQLTEALWPDADGDAAHEACAITLHRLRKLLGHDQAISLQNNQLSLDPRYVWVDTWAFEHWLAQIDKLDSSTGRHASEKAIALYQGAFLGKQNEAPWTLPPRERLRTKFLRHLVQWGRSLLQAGECEQAILVFENGLEVDALAEECYRHLMRCYQSLDRRAEAISVYQRCRKTLAAVLGISPAPETEALYQALRQK
jgi:DNA-binding SARP family transcriptional activator